MGEVKTINKAFQQALAEMDEADIKAIEQNLDSIPIENVMDRISSVGGQFFSVDFARKNDKKVKGVVVEHAGDIRHMICRRGVAKYVKGVQAKGQRKAEDSVNAVLTVWDIGVYQSMRKEGLEQEKAGGKSYRRINMADVKAISIAPVVENVQEQEKVEVAEPVEAI